MIDPKLNEIPVTNEDLTNEDMTEDERIELRRRAASAGSDVTQARGLSINDTIARDANLSVGGRGVDTSGVSAGAGAGAGSTIVTPTTDNSPAPRIVPGERGTGMSPLADAPSGETSTDRTKG